MLSDLSKKPNPLPDPETLMVGKCGGCGHLVEAQHRDVFVGAIGRVTVGQQHGEWEDCPHMACPQCGAVVYMQPKQKPINDPNTVQGKPVVPKELIECLRWLLKTVPMRYKDVLGIFVCHHCLGRALTGNPHNIEHNPGCPWVNANELLARYATR